MEQALQEYIEAVKQWARVANKIMDRIEGKEFWNGLTEKESEEFSKNI